MTLRLAFMGTPDFAVPTLAELDRPGPRHRGGLYPAGAAEGPRLASRTVAGRQARAHAWPRGPHARYRSKDADAQADFAALELDAAIVVAYGLLLPKPILDAPRLGCFNLHGSLLPRWRGAAPIQRAIMAGDAETGVMVMHMEEGLDTGPVLMAEKTPIGRKTYGELHDELARLGADLMARALAALERGTAVETAAAGERRDLREEDREGRSAHRLDEIRARDRLPDPRPVALARRVVRSERRAAEDPLCRAGRRPRRAGRSSGRRLDHRLGRRRAEALAPATRRTRRIGAGGIPAGLSA